MHTINIDFQTQLGKIKPMHSVNNGPVYKFAEDQRITNMDAYKAAGIPMARTHDASFYSTYGGEHTVDVNMIFPDFDADPNDPASYDFVLTDEYMRVIDFAGTKIFYRLGSKIEHWPKKYNTIPPKDFQKWAVICEHIIRHLNEGWADGLHLGIEYWEIWNEPDLDSDDSDNKRCWGGTKAEFFDLYEITAKHLKARFPNLKIGGPALAFDLSWAKDFLMEMKKRDVPMDFFSYHIYANYVERIEKRILTVEALLHDTGWEGTETILNEWNYVRGWTGDDWIYTLRAEKGLKGAAFIASTMLMAQKSSLNHLMYYDARPCGMNGMFSTDFVCDCLKGYYPFLFFNTLYRLGTEVCSVSDSPDIRAVAASGDDGRAVMLSYYDEDDDAPEKDAAIRLLGLSSDRGVKVECFLLDAEHDGELIRTERVASSDATIYLHFPKLSTYLIKISNL